MSNFSTISLSITFCSDVEYINQHSTLYSYAFRRMYKMIEESQNKDIINQFKEKYNLTDIGYRSLINDVKSTIISEEEIQKQKIKDIEILNNDIEDLKCKIHELENIRNKKYYQYQHKKSKLIKKLNKKRSSLNNKIVFGGRKLLKDISNLSNNIYKYNNEDDKERLKKLKEQFNNNRKNRGIFLIGEANQKGNRFFKFDLINNTIEYRPNKDKKIIFNFKYRNKVLLSKLQQLIDNKIISITITVKSNQLLLTFDNEILSGYSFNKQEVNKLIKQFKENNKKLSEDEIKKGIKNIYIEEHNRIKEIKLIDKIENRCISIDLNPEYIGYSVLELNNDGSLNILEKKCFSIEKLSKRLGKKSNSKEQQYQNNKRKFETIDNIITLFKVAKNYKCYKFCIEDLNFKDNNNNSFGKEFNRKVKNIWNLELIKNIINKYSILYGMEIIEVNPVYTSFIGNIIHEYFDPVNSSIEIGRRGLLKYKKGTFYPEITDEILNTVVTNIGTDVSIDKNDCSWMKLYQASKESRWRRGIEYNLQTISSKNTIKSKVTLYSY